MTDDQPEDQPQYDSNDNGGGGSGGGGGIGGGGLLSLLPLLFGLFRSKLGIAVLIIGGIAYFMFGRGCNMGGGMSNAVSSNAPDPKNAPACASPPNIEPTPTRTSARIPQTIMIQCDQRPAGLDQINLTRDVQVETRLDNASVDIAAIDRRIVAHALAAGLG